MDFFQQLLYTFVGFKLLLVIAAVGTALLPSFQRVKARLLHDHLVLVQGRDGTLARRHLKLVGPRRSLGSYVATVDLDEPALASPGRGVPGTARSRPSLPQAGAVPAVAAVPVPEPALVSITAGGSDTARSRPGTAARRLPGDANSESSPTTSTPSRLGRLRSWKACLSLARLRTCAARTVRRVRDADWKCRLGIGCRFHCQCNRAVYENVVHVVSMLLFIGYPSISVKAMQVFHCVDVDATSYLVVDMRLQCYTARWSLYALYSVIMFAVYVIGFPLAIFAVLFRNRHTLYGDDSAATHRMYGFLYDGFGQSACYWEVEELIRKLLLTAAAVLLDAANPLQVSAMSVVSRLFLSANAGLIDQ